MEPLTAAEGFSGSARARIGRPQRLLPGVEDRLWNVVEERGRRESLLSPGQTCSCPQGGETCNSKPDAQPFIGCENALKELAYQRFTALNIGYEKKRAGRLGPRVAVWRKSARVLGIGSDSRSRRRQCVGREVTVSVTVRNDGLRQPLQSSAGGCWCCVIALQARCNAWTATTDPRRLDAGGGVHLHRASDGPPRARTMSCCTCPTRPKRCATGPSFSVRMGESRSVGAGHRDEPAGPAWLRSRAEVFFEERNHARPDLVTMCERAGVAALEQE